jgi:hypothetical protein
LKNICRSIPTVLQFCLPAVLTMAAGKRFPFKKLRVSQIQNILENVKSTEEKPNSDYIDRHRGIFGTFRLLSPTNLKQVFYLSEHLTYVGIFYVLYSPAHKKMIVPGDCTHVILNHCYRDVWGICIHVACSHPYSSGIKYSFS